MKFAYKASNLKESTGSTFFPCHTCLIFVGMFRQDRCFLLNFLVRIGYFIGDPIAKQIEKCVQVIRRFVIVRSQWGNISFLTFFHTGMIYYASWMSATWKVLQCRSLTLNSLKSWNRRLIPYSLLAQYSVNLSQVTFLHQSYCLSFFSMLLEECNLKAGCSLALLKNASFAIYTSKCTANWRLFVFVENVSDSFVLNVLVSPSFPHISFCS
jgi:hypothetical protein